METTSSGDGLRQEKRSKGAATAIYALSQDILRIIFSRLNPVELIRCSAVCTSWCYAVDKMKLLEVQYCQQQDSNFTGLHDAGGLMKIHLRELAMAQHKSSLYDGEISICQWEGHSRVDQCRMKMGRILTGVADKVIKIWSAESYECLYRYFLPDNAPLIDVDFDESKVVGLVGTRLCLWKHEKREIFSSCEDVFIKGLCMRYVDPVAVVGCEDGKARVFDFYSRTCSQIIRIYDAPLACLSLTDDQLIVSGSTFGSILISDLSSGERVAKLRSTASVGCMRTLCYNPCSHLLFAGSDGGYASCWDLRTMRSVWENRVSPNVLYSMHHMRDDTSTLVVGGIDGVLRVMDQDQGKVISSCISYDSDSISSVSKDVCSVDGRNQTSRRTCVERKKGSRLSGDYICLDLIPKVCRPPITCLAVGMQKVVTVHNGKYVRVWKFR